MSGDRDRPRTIPAGDAFQRSRDNRFARWTGSAGSAAARLDGRVLVPESAPSFRAAGDERIFAIGSCFARNVEERLELAGATVTSRDLRIDGLGDATPRLAGNLNKYNPFSILQELQFAAGERGFPEDALLPLAGGALYDSQLRMVAAPGPAGMLLRRREQIAGYFARAFAADVVILTLGLTEAWLDRRTGLYLVEAPAPQVVRREPERFAFDLLDAARCAAALLDIHDLLRRRGKPGLKLVVTVSPVPLGRTFTGADVVTANTLSKATLRVAAGELVRRRQADYFPSYEAAVSSDPALVWTADRRHVTDFMVGRIIAAFMERYGFAPATPADAAEAEPAEAALHRRLAGEAEGYRRRILELEAELRRLAPPGAPAAKP